MIFYLGTESFAGISLVNTPDSKGIEGIVELRGSLPQLGDFKVEVTPGPDTNQAPVMGNPDAWAEQPLDRSIYTSVIAPPADVWKAKGNRISLLRWSACS